MTEVVDDYGFSNFGSVGSLASALLGSDLLCGRLGICSDDWVAYLYHHPRRGEASKANAPNSLRELSVLHRRLQSQVYGASPVGTFGGCDRVPRLLAQPEYLLEDSGINRCASEKTTLKVNENFTDRPKCSARDETELQKFFPYKTIKRAFQPP